MIMFCHTSIDNCPYLKSQKQMLDESVNSTSIVIEQYYFQLSIEVG